MQIVTNHLIYLPLAKVAFFILQKDALRLANPLYFLLYRMKNYLTYLLFILLIQIKHLNQCHFLPNY